MKVKDIPGFHVNPSYTINVSWGYIEDTLIQWGLENDKPLRKLDLNPDFQRGHVWSEDKQIAFVEFCLMGGISSRTILFNHPNWQGSYENGPMVLVDGKQRLEAVRKFLRSELPIFNGNYLKDFDDPKLLLRWSNAQLIFAVNNLKTKKLVLEWYLQLNTGVVVHTPDEIQKVKDLLAKEA